MNKKEVQKRVLKDGKQLSIDLFSWCEDTRTFSSYKDRMVVDFSGVDQFTIEPVSDCTIETGFKVTI